VQPFSTLIFEKQAGAAWVTLNRPQVLNAYNTRMRDELTEVLTAVQDDDEVRALVLRGAGRAFCAGADLTEFGTAPSPTAARRIRFARDVWGLLHGLRVPSVASMHGYAFGSGLEIALFCDLRIAAEGTQFAMPEVQLGFIPAAGGTQTLPRACGLGCALDLLLTGRTIDSSEAQRRGILSEVVPPGHLAARTDALVQHLVGLSPQAVYAVRRAVREGMDLTLEQGLRLEAQLAAAQHRNRGASRARG